MGQNLVSIFLGTVYSLLGYSLVIDPHFDSHHFQRFYNEKASKTEVFDAFCRVSTEKMPSFRIHLNQFIGDMPALCYEYPVKVLLHPFFW